MIAIGYGLAWVSYTLGMKGWALLQGWDISFAQLASPVSWYQGPWPPPLIGSAQTWASGARGVGQQVGGTLQQNMPTHEGGVRAGVTPKQIYDALTAAGASTNQAIGIMANAINESSLDPEAAAMDTNGYMSYGLNQWNAASYPGASSLVTGNPVKDLKAQVKFLATTGGFQAANGSSAAAAAGNFVANYERCQGCQPGGSQYQARTGNAATVSGWASSGQWPASQGSPTAGGQAPAGAAAGSDCVFSLGGQHAGILFGHGPTLPSACLLTKSEARAITGVALLIPAGIIGLVAVGLLAAAGFRLSGAADKAGRLVEGIGSGVAVVPGGQAAGQGLRAGGAAVRGQGRTAASRAGGAVRTQRRQKAATARKTATAQRKAAAARKRAAPKTPRPAGKTAQRGAAGPPAASAGTP